MDILSTHTVSPFNDFPAEIIEAIFIRACPAVFLTENVFKRGELESPWKLELVCTQWSKIAILYQALWSTIIIDAGYHFSSFSIDPQITLALERSGTQPLSISVAGRTEASRDVCKIIRKLTSHSNRIHSFALRFHYDDLNSLFMGWNITACLRKLVTNEPKLLCYSSGTPWSHLTNLTLLKINRDGEELLAALKIVASHLISLVLRHISFQLRRWTPNNGKVTFKALRELFIIGYPQHFILLLEGLTCPALENFGVRRSPIRSGNLSSITFSMARFLVRSSCRLMSLSLTGVTVRNKDILQILRQITTLSRLHIVFEQFSDWQIDLLTLDDQSTVKQVAPAVRYIQLEYLRNVDLEELIDPLYDMLASRRAASIRHLMEGVETLASIDVFLPLQEFVLKFNSSPANSNHRHLDSIWGDELLVNLHSFCIASKINLQVNHRFVEIQGDIVSQDWFDTASESDSD